MSRLATRIKDKRVLLLIRSFLTAGVMLGGLVEASEEGTRNFTARRRGRSISQVIRELNTFTRGWWNYYGITESYNRLRPLGFAQK